VSNATSGSPTDRLTREHRMTADEARLILNVKKEDAAERLLQQYEHLFKANAQPPPAPKVTTGRQPPPPVYSHYLHSKVVRARERLNAEAKAGETPASPPPSESPPPPPGPSS